MAKTITMEAPAMITKGLGMADQVWGNLKDQKISLSVLAAIIYILYLGHGWAENSFIPLANAEEYASASDVKHIQVMVKANGTLLSEHIEEYRIDEAIKVVENIEGDIANLRALESIGGATVETQTLMNQLSDRLGHAQAYCDCLMKNEPNCRHLKNGR